MSAWESWRAWCRRGLDPEQFWRLTPREVGLVHEARDDMDMDQANAMRWQAYHVALWQRAKKMPPWLRVVLRRRQRQDLGQMMSAAMAWTRLMGGRVRRRTHDGG